MNKNQINRKKTDGVFKRFAAIYKTCFFRKSGDFFIFFHISGDFIQTFFFIIICQETHSVFSYIFKRGKYTKLDNVC